MPLAHVHSFICRSRTSALALACGRKTRTSDIRTSQSMGAQTSATSDDLTFFDFLANQRSLDARDWEGGAPWSFSSFLMMVAEAQKKSTVMVGEKMSTAKMSATLGSSFELVRASTSSMTVSKKMANWAKRLRVTTSHVQPTKKAHELMMKYCASKVHR